MAYPASLDNLHDDVPADGIAAATSLGDVTYPHDDHHRDLAGAIEAVQAELGLNPSGALATVALAIAAKQDLDTDLTAIAALTSAANKVLYATGAGTWALADLTAAGRAILDDADASAQLTTLGVSTFIKTLLDDADASTALTTLGVSTFIKTLLDDADQATARTTLGVGTGDSPQFTAVNVGAATDTTITRTGAGDIAVEGNGIYRAGGTDVALADGGTGSSTASGARTNLGIQVWTTYTPTITQSGTVTKTIDYASYFEVGKMVTVIFRMTVTANGTTNNAITVSLPVTAATSGLDVGVFSVYDGSVPARYAGIANLLTTTTVQGIVHSTTLATAIGQNPNFALANAQDIILGSITYPAA